MKCLALLVFICCIINSDAQFCDGNLGDPIINMDFGASGFKLKRNTTSLEAAGGCPGKGQYIISSFLFGCGSNNDHSWIKMIGDHTRNLNGNYMLVNAESTPATIFKDTAKNLCSNSNYVFTAWISNAMQDFTCGGNPVLANLTFTVTKMDGTVLMTSSTGDIPTADDRVWKQYGLAFTTPANTDEVLVSITTNPKFGCGSGFVIDDIIVASCGPLVSATIDGSTEDANVCADYTNPFILNGTYSTYYNNTAVQWQSSKDSGATWQDIPGQTTTTYKIPRRSIGAILYRLAVAEKANINSLNCRIYSNIIYTEVHPLPPHKAPQNIIGCIGKELHLPEADPSALNVEWSGPNQYNSTEFAPVISDINIQDTGLYKLVQHFYFGCTSRDTLYLKVYPGTTIAAQTLYSVCEGKSVTLNTSGQGSFKWTPPTGLSNDAVANPIASPHDSTEYKVILTNTYGCKDSALVTVNVFRNPLANAGPDKVIVLGDTATLDGVVSGTAINFLWSPVTYMQDNTSATPKVFPPQNVTYTLTTTSTVGCGNASDAVNVRVFKDIAIPSAFTPNGDGKNDVFKIYGADGYTLLKFVIYNRLGQLVYSSKNSGEGWDGTFHNIQQPAATYVYYIELQKKDAPVLSKKGTITIVR